MSTRAEASRANGAKSKGPKSEETRAKSSANSLRHGLTSRHVILLSGEDGVEFQRLSDEDQQLFQPASIVEIELVRNMIAARWRVRRLWAMEATLLDEEINRPLSEFDDTPDAGGAVLIAQAFRRLSDESRALSLISRYESRLQREHDRSLRTLRELRQSPIPAPLSQVEPEPSRPEVPASEPEVPAIKAWATGVKTAGPKTNGTKEKNVKTNPGPVVEFPSPVPQRGTNER
ncbi:MAG: hypothetical protein ABIZ80_05725 [Bryobacteraceae bacterium]